jgi:hypothetical protein
LCQKFSSHPKPPENKRSMLLDLKKEGHLFSEEKKQKTLVFYALSAVEPRPRGRFGIVHAHDQHHGKMP